MTAQAAADFLNAGDRWRVEDISTRKHRRKGKWACYYRSEIHVGHGTTQYRTHAELIALAKREGMPEVEG